MAKILEMSSRDSKGGRRKIKIVLHKIHTDETETNLNGLHWTEQNTLANIGSVSGIPICAEFLTDDKDVPNGHGYTSTEVIEGKKTPLFENSEVCGYIDKAEICDVDVNGSIIRALVGTGYIYNQRYPKLTAWVKESLKSGNVDTSIEIMGKEENDMKIVYDETCEVSENFRIPKDYSYSGVAILNVLPADENAIVLECATARNQIKEEIFKMTEQEILEVVAKAITESNSATADAETKIAEANSIVTEKEARIAECETEISELTKAKEDAENKIAELESKCTDLEKELNEMKKVELNNALDKMLEKYSAEEKACVESEINAYKENPFVGNADAIVSKICVAIVNKQKETEAIAEQNSAKDADLDIFSEVNSTIEEEMDDNIF